LARVNEIGKGSAYKRLGFLAETVLGGEPSIVAACSRDKTTGAIKLDPAIWSRGHLVRRWGLWVNTRVAEEDDSA
jgi:hypothetical protein